MTIKNKENVLIIGASGHSKMIIDIIIKNDNYNIIGLIDSYKQKGEKVFGFQVIGCEKDIPDVMNHHNIRGCIIGIGDNWTRKKMKEMLEKQTPNLSFISVVHPSAILAVGVQIPKGTVVMAGAIINANARIGEFCIINTNSSLGHDSIMQDYSSLASGVTIGGNVNIGFCSVISLGASVIHDITIGDHTVIGAGSLVLSNMESYITAYGIPSIKIKSRHYDENYLS